MGLVGTASTQRNLVVCECFLSIKGHRREEAIGPKRPYTQAEAAGVNHRSYTTCMGTTSVVTDYNSSSTSGRNEYLTVSLPYNDGILT